MEYWRREIRRAGGEVWFGALGVGAFVDGHRMKGVVVATPEGRGVVLAKVVVDGTGNADIPAAAGAECRVTTDYELAMQGAGLPRWELGARYINTDWTYIDDCDVVDAWSAFVVAKRRNASAFDLGQLIDTRERRRIVGDITLTPIDIVNRRRFPDTIALSNGGRLDKHGFTVHPYYMICNWRGGITYTPYRCLLPKGWDGVIVVGLGVSAHCDAIPSIRMQPCMQNLGYAAGLAAAMAAKLDGHTRQIDIRALQRRLVREHVVTPDVLEGKDSFPLPESKVRQAVDWLAKHDYSSLSVILARPKLAVQLLRAAYCDPAISDEGKLRCAHVLGMLGDATGVDALVKKVDSFREFDQESIDRYFPWATWLDSYMIALGRTRDPKALRPLLDKLDLLLRSGSNRASHTRAIALALEALGDPRAAKPLAELLKRTRGAAAAVTKLRVDELTPRDKRGMTELLLARVLYRLGDYQGMGERVLRAFAKDLRGHYARHARAVLARISHRSSASRDEP